MTKHSSIPCPCHGSGTIEKDGKLYECMCQYLRRRAAGMPDFIRKAVVLDDHVKLPYSKEVNKMLYITGDWRDIKAIMKLAIIRHPKLYLRVTSDREILDVFLGRTSRTSRADAPSDTIMESISDLMEPPNLAVIRLNELFYKNKAAPGVLEEALSYRLDRDKPTWVIADNNHPFVSGSTAWSQSVVDLLSENMQTVKIPLIHQKAAAEGASLSVEPVAAMSPSNTGLKTKTNTVKPKEKVIETEKETEVEPVAHNSGLGMFGSGIAKSKTSFGSRRD